MKRLVRTAAPALAALLLAGCADQMATMTQHFFYGYVASADGSRLCLSDARTEDLDAEKCFTTTDVDTASVSEGDLVRVRYEPVEGDGHGGGTAISVQTVRAGGRSDG